jgi:hypothetical protein
MRFPVTGECIGRLAGGAKDNPQIEVRSGIIRPDAQCLL